ncbi:MAG: uroporphyrinogen decarboxylase family protein [Fimbriimonadales bacterium]
MKWPSGQNLPRTHAKPTFSEAWFNKRFGLEFGERYHRDPIHRTEQDRGAMRLVYERFGHLGIGEMDPAPKPHLEICGHRFLPAMLGCEILFQDDQAPASVHMSLDSPQDLSRFVMPDLCQNKWAVDFRRQARQLLERYGEVDATINHGGPINVASNVFGTEAFLLMVDEPVLFRKFLRLIADLCILTYDELTLPLNPRLGAGREMFIGNCPVMMLDPATYVEEILPADLSIRRRVERFGLHHCGSMDRYLAAYRRLEPLEFLEVGWGSTIALVREAFLDTLLDLMVSVKDISAMPPDALQEAMADMIAAALPLSFVRDVFMADVGPDVLDATIETFVEAVDRAFAMK